MAREQKSFYRQLVSFENQKNLGIVHSLEFFAPLIFAQIRAKVRKTVLKITSYEVRKHRTLFNAEVFADDHCLNVNYWRFYRRS